MKLNPSLLFCALGLTLILPGCLSGPKLGSINVTVVSFQSAGESASATPTAVMIVRFANGNIKPVAFSSSSFKLYVNELYVGKATSETPVGLPASGSVNLNVMLKLEDPKAVRLALGVSGEIAKYRLESLLHYSEGDQEKRLSTSFTGTVSLLGLESAVH